MINLSAAKDWAITIERSRSLMASMALWSHKWNNYLFLRVIFKYLKRYFTIKVSTWLNQIDPDMFGSICLLKRSSLRQSLTASVYELIPALMSACNLQEAIPLFGILLTSPIFASGEVPIP